MVDTASLLTGMAIGALLGGLGVAAFMIMRRGRTQAELANALARAELLDQQARVLAVEITDLRAALEATSQERESARREAAVLSEQLRARQKQFDEQRQMLTDAQATLKDVFRALGAEALAANNQQFLQLAEQKFNPIRELLEKQREAVSALEMKRESAYATLDQKFQQIAASHEKLGTETGRLVSALRRPEQRGKWGELQLRNAVELAGMTEHCDFLVQPTVESEEGMQRPDMIVNLPGGGVIPIDSKVALDAYLDALQPESDRDGQMKRHARHVQDHVTRLADKKYWEQFERTPGVVVLFMPLESALSAALEVRPELLSEAMSRHVLLASPTLLVALLRAVAYGWQQESLTANARQIGTLGKELYDRVRKFVGDLEDIGDKISAAAKAYNSAIGSLEGRLLPGARRLRDLHLKSEAEIESLGQVETEVRRITAAELTSLPAGGAVPQGELPE